MKLENEILTTEKRLLEAAEGYGFELEEVDQRHIKFSRRRTTDDEEIDDRYILIPRPISFNTAISSLERMAMQQDGLIPDIKIPIPIKITTQPDNKMWESKSFHPWLEDDMMPKLEYWTSAYTMPQPPGGHQYINEEVQKMMMQWGMGARGEAA